MKSTKVQTLGANTICVCDWSCAGEKLANTTTATGAMQYTVEPLNKGHHRTEGIVPYLEVVPYWEVSQKK